MDSYLVFRSDSAPRDAVALCLERLESVGFVCDFGVASDFDYEGFSVDRCGVVLNVEWSQPTGMEIRFGSDPDDEIRQEIIALVAGEPAPELSTSR